MTDHPVLAARVGGLEDEKDPILPFGVEEFLKIPEFFGKFFEFLFSMFLLSIEGEAFGGVDFGEAYLAVGWHTVPIHLYPLR
jgi:hypothetical protein